LKISRNSKNRNNKIPIDFTDEEIQTICELDMDMNIGDVLDWEVHAAGEKGKKYAKVRKLE
jgi:hypothetical protein